MAPQNPQDNDRALLSSAIETATPSRLRKAFQEICDKSPEAFNLACSALLTKPGTAAAAEGSNAASAGDKRKRFEICIQCEKEYNVETNDEKSCVWHSGELDVDDDDDFWADHDEDIHGIIDSDELREQYPEGYTWSCCGERGGTSEGCERGPHESEPGMIAKSSRTRLGYILNQDT
ncbi:hypothetical protein DM02DRAFT_599716 [Periconia macrospinosa]|uniref:Uncharacterized protein n=1 Tax=Periconia macrospinosa TaxID=97972 RepID=A0A2V1DEX5_9PLEO|nr:hypothetical protein DM02DRAFT_599716 [Periconia macrospinosa]